MGNLANDSAEYHCDTAAPDRRGDFWYTSRTPGSHDVIVGSGAQLLEALVRRNTAVVREHPFVRRCAAGKATLPALKIFLAQHGKYGAHFTRYLCAVIANVEDGGDAAQLARNLADELGYGHEHAEPHSAIYARMLADFGLDQKRAPTLPGTQALIDTMSGYCRRENAAYGLAALYLGAEAIVPALYGDIMAGFLACGVPEASLEFFSIHIACDDGHGRVMHDILVRMLDQDPALREAAHEAATRTISARLDFFTNLEWEAA
jgi:pyrroloquinoline-quinone synthase